MNTNECKCCHVSETSVEDTRDIRIVILQRGWVFVGVFSQKGSLCSLDNGFNIRKWGTTKGLGELVNGALSDTKLDPIPHTEFHELTVVAMMKCNAAAWKLK